MTLSESPLIRFEQFTLRDARQQLLLSLTMEVDEPGIIGVVGPEGAGKSLLLLALAGRLPRGINSSGVLHLAGKPPQREELEPPLRPETPVLRGSIFRALTHPMP